MPIDMCSWSTLRSNYGFESNVSLNYQGYEVNRKGLHYQNAMLIRIAMFGGLHMESSCLETPENLIEC